MVESVQSRLFNRLNSSVIVRTSTPRCPRCLSSSPPSMSIDLRTDNRGDDGHGDGEMKSTTRRKSVRSPNEADGMGLRRAKPRIPTSSTIDGVDGNIHVRTVWRKS